MNIETLRTKVIESEELLKSINRLTEEEKNNLYFMIKGIELRDNAKKLPIAVGM